MTARRILPFDPDPFGGGLEGGLKYLDTILKMECDLHLLATRSVIQFCAKYTHKNQPSELLDWLAYAVEEGPDEVEDLVRALRTIAVTEEKEEYDGAR